MTINLVLVIAGILLAAILVYSALQIAQRLSEIGLFLLALGYHFGDEEFLEIIGVTEEDLFR